MVNQVSYFGTYIDIYKCYIEVAKLNICGKYV